MMVKRLLIASVLFFTLGKIHATTYYLVNLGSLTTPSSWNTSRTSGGASPAGFTGANDVFIIQTGQLANNSGTWNFGGTGTILEIESGATLTAGATLNMNPASIFKVDSSGTYIHNTTNNSTFLGTENFAATSNVKVLKWASGTPITTGITLPYGNLEIALTSSVTSWNQGWSSNFTLCAGNFTITDPGSGFYCTQTATANVFIGGNFSISLGTFDLANGTTGVCNLFLKGNFNQTGGTITASTGSGSFQFNKLGVQTFRRSGTGMIASKPVNFIVLPGATLDMSTVTPNTNVIDNTTGYFTVNNGAGLIMGQAIGIAATSTTVGHIRNTGSRFFEFGAYYTYKGTAAQATGDGLPIAVAGLAIDNNSSLTLSNPLVDVSDSLTLTSGLIKTDATHTITLISTAKVSSPVNIYGEKNTGHATSYVNGPLQITRNSTDTITLPIGKDTSTGSFYAPVKLVPSSASSQAFQAEYFPVRHFDYTNADPGYVDHVSSIEHWRISANVAGATAKVGLSWRPASKVGGSNPAVDSARAWDSLVVAHYINSGGNKWSRDGASLTANDSIRPGSTLSYGYVISRNYNLINSAFTLGTRSSIKILPLKIVLWQAVKSQDHVQLKWTVENERTIKNYTIERSNDGLQFQAVGSLAALNTKDIQSYDFIDARMLNSTTFYRLVIKDIQGRITYSSTVAILFNTASKNLIFPNPATNNITISYEKLPNGSAYTISSYDGKKIMEGILTDNTTQTTIDIHKLPAGTYILEAGNGVKKITYRFLKR